MPAVSKTRKSTFRDLAAYSAVGINLVVSVLIGTYIGYKADQYLGTAPWLMIAGIIFGAVAGFYSLYEVMYRGEEEEGDGNGG